MLLLTTYKPLSVFLSKLASALGFKNTVLYLKHCDLEQV